MQMSRREMARGGLVLLAMQAGLAQSEEAPAKPTAPAASGTIGHAPSPFGAWRDAVVRDLSKRKRYPTELYKTARSAKQTAPSGTTLLGFAIDRTGKIVEASVKTSSGFPAFDKAALAMAPVGHQLPQPPSLPTEPFRLAVEVRFVGNEYEPD